jgi:nicotinamidase-related amidase
MERPAEEKLEPLPRSPELMNRDDTAVLVVDVQERLIALVPGHLTIVWNIRRLLDAAAALALPVACTEQNPEKLGPTTAPLAKHLSGRLAKMAFSCGGCEALQTSLDSWRNDGVFRILLCGIETHVCIQQTAFDLTAAGFEVYLAVDATGARRDIDHATALRRMESAGIILTTTEAAMFEWCRTAGTPEFRKISVLAKESSPTTT